MTRTDQLLINAEIAKTEEECQLWEVVDIIPVDHENHYKVTFRRRDGEGGLAIAFNGLAV